MGVSSGYGLIRYPRAQYMPIFFKNQAISGSYVKYKHSHIDV
jgi:hypothetical protein